MPHHDAWLRHQQSRWLRPGADRWVRADAARFLARGTSIAEAFPALARKYSPNQPRVPAGSPDGGQWTDGSSIGQRPRVIIDTTNLDSDESGDSDSVFGDGIGPLNLFDITPQDAAIDGVQLAGDVPPAEEPPEIPPPRRSIAERSIDFIRRAAEYVRTVGPLSHAADAFF